MRQYLLSLLLLVGLVLSSCQPTSTPPTAFAALPSGFFGGTSSGLYAFVTAGKQRPSPPSPPPAEPPSPPPPSPPPPVDPRQTALLAVIRLDGDTILPFAATAQAKVIQALWLYMPPYVNSTADITITGVSTTATSRRRKLQATAGSADVTTEFNVADAHSVEDSGAHLADVIDEPKFLTTLQTLGLPASSAVLLSTKSTVPGLDAPVCTLNNSTGTCLGVASNSNEGKLIGIIVGVILACVIMLLIIVCCYCIHRRRYKTAAPAGSTVEPKEDSVYVHGLRLGSDKAAPNSPEHMEKMRKLQAMSFARTKSSPFGKDAAKSPGAAGTSPEAIGAKGFAFPNIVAPGGGEAFGSPMSPKGVGLISQLFSTKSGSPQVNAVWEASRREAALKQRTINEGILRSELKENRMRGKSVNTVPLDFQHRAEYFRSEGKTAAYFERNVDVLANPKEEVLVYDTESWSVWKAVWDTFERDGVPRSEDLNTMRRFQIKFKHLWDASERSVRSAAVTAPEAHNADVPPGPLEQALSTREGDTLTMTRSGPSDAASMGQVPKQGSRALGLTGRLSSLFSRRSSMGDVSQHDDDFSGSSYMQREY